jgi:hypothetical protein
MFRDVKWVSASDVSFTIGDPPEALWMLNEDGTVNRDSFHIEEKCPHKEKQMLIDKQVEGFRRGADDECEWIEGYAVTFDRDGEPVIIVSPDIEMLKANVRRMTGQQLDEGGVRKVRVRSCDE